VDIRREWVEEGLGGPQEVGEAVSTNEGGKKGRTGVDTEGRGLVSAESGAVEYDMICLVRDRVIGG
jgi:hypothetical protein